MNDSVRGLVPSLREKVRQLVPLPPIPALTYNIGAR